MCLEHAIRVFYSYSLLGGNEYLSEEIKKVNYFVQPSDINGSRAGL